jgi:hypothetical protein
MNKIFFEANPAIIPKKIDFGKVLLAQKGTSCGRSFCATKLNAKIGFVFPFYLG